MIEDRLVWFDPVRDSQEVDQFGYIDLVEVFQKGSLSSDVNLRDSNFNEINDPSSILGKPKDIFEAQRMADDINARANSVKEVTSVKPSKAAPSVIR